MRAQGSSGSRPQRCAARSEGVSADHPEDELVGVAAAVAGAVDQWAVLGIADQALITADQIDADALRRIVAADGGEAELLHAAIGVIGLQATLPRLRAGHPEVVILVILRADNKIALEQKAPLFREAVSHTPRVARRCNRRWRR